MDSNPATNVILVVILAMGLVAAMQFPISRICRRNPAIAAWKPLIVLSSIVWGGMFIAKESFLHAIWLTDAIAHEEAARVIAHLIQQTGLSSSFEFFGVGNSGLRFFVGVFYAYTNAPEALLMVFLGYLGFSGMLILLDVLIRSTKAVRCPFWLVFLICFYPEALFWCIDLLKEGPVMWGLCTMLQLIVPDPARNTLRHKVWYFFGAGVAMFFRPHITFAWLVAMGIAKALKPKQFGLAILIAGCAAGSFALMHVLAPQLMDAVMRRGSVETLEESFRKQTFDSGGSAIRYVGGVPTPIVDGMLLLFLRPFPQEAPHAIGFFAGAEAWFLTTTAIVSWFFLGRRRQYLMSPLILTSLLTIVFMSFFFSYMFNMGLMVRYRMQVFPAIIALAATPGLARRSPSYYHGQARLPRAYAVPLGRFTVPGRMVARPVSLPRPVVPRPRFR